MNGGFTSGNLNGCCSFTSISDFKWSMKCGGEVVFIWNGIKYCCFGKLKAPGTEKTTMFISKAEGEDGWETSEK